MKKIDEYREFVTINLTKIGADVENIKETNRKVEKHLELLNGRVRDNEKSISWIKGIGSTITFIIASFIGYLFKE